MDDVGLNIVDDGVVNQSRWALVVARLGRKESSNIGLQSLNRPAGESTLKEASHCAIGDVLLGEFCRSHGICDTCFRQKKEDVDKLLLLCQADCKSPGSHGEYNPTMDSKGCVMWG